MKKLISIVSPCYNEEGNIENLYKALNAAIDKVPNYAFEFLFIDNNSSDRTPDILKDLAARDKRVKIIFNVRNFGHIRSPYWGILQAQGDAVIYLASDLQDPPELIPEFIKSWELGWKIVFGTKPKTKQGRLFHLVRTIYYKVLDAMSDVRIIQNATGFGMYDKDVVNHLRAIQDPYPFLRGLVCELGYPIKTVDFIQPSRSSGRTKNNWLSLYDIGMLGIVSHTIWPLRIASLVGYFIALACIFVSISYLIMKLFYWNSFPIGFAPLVIGFFFLIAMVFIFLGFIGEYLAYISSHVRSRPIVVERERINF